MDETEIAKFLEQSKSTSVSKGCFAFKGKKKQIDSANYFSDGDSKSVERRLEAYGQLWSEISGKVQALQNEASSSIFEDVIQFAERAYRPGQTGRVSFMREIPTAALLTGVNMPDHDIMFANLTTMLRTRVSDRVAVLRSNDCVHIKHMTQNLIEQIVADDPKGIHIKRSSPTISTLAKWYDETMSFPVSPPKKPRRKSKTTTPPVNNERKPIVIILEDLERFNPGIVQDFVLACSNHLDRLPLILILGVATAVTTIHRLLPQAVSSLLSVEKFQAAPSSGHFSNVLTQTIMTSEQPFKLGARVFQQLVDIFLMHDFSVMNYASSLQFLLMDHFMTNKASVLCCYESDAETVVQTLSKQSLVDIRQCSSFMRFVEDAPPNVQHALLLKDDILKEHIVIWLQDLHEYHRHFFPIVECLNKVTSHLPRALLGRQLREVYGRCLESNIYEQDDYKTCFAILNTASRDTLVTLLNECVLNLAQYPYLRLETVAKSLADFVKKFLDIENTATEVVVDDVDEEDAMTSLPKKLDMMSLRKRLKDMKDRKKKLTVYEVLRKETLDFLDATFKRYLRCYKAMPLYECFYNESSTNVRQHINASPLTCLHLALTNPQHYLKNERAHSEVGSINEFLPDISIIFKLHLECGRLINLYDWLQAFVTIVTSTKKTAKQADKTLQARFIRAVCELQFIGFIKSTQRKTDHVQRLTWGGC